MEQFLANINLTQELVNESGVSECEKRDDDLLDFPIEDICTVN